MVFCHLRGIACGSFDNLLRAVLPARCEYQMWRAQQHASGDGVETIMLRHSMRFTCPLWLWAVGNSMLIQVRAACALNAVEVKQPLLSVRRVNLRVMCGLLAMCGLAEISSRHLLKAEVPCAFVLSR